MINEVVDNYKISFQSESYINWINDLLKPRINPKLPVVVDLFAGCGGLSLGFEAHGFPTIGFENNTDATATYSLNLQGECHCLTLSCREYLENDFRYSVEEIKSNMKYPNGCYK